MMIQTPGCLVPSLHSAGTTCQAQSRCEQVSSLHLGSRTGIESVEEGTQQVIQSSASSALCCQEPCPASPPGHPPAPLAGTYSSCKSLAGPSYPCSPAPLQWPSFLIPVPTSELCIPRLERMHRGGERPAGWKYPAQYVLHIPQLQTGPYSPLM